MKRSLGVWVESRDLPREGGKVFLSTATIAEVLCWMQDDDNNTMGVMAANMGRETFANSLPESVLLILKDKLRTEILAELEALKAAEEADKTAVWVNRNPMPSTIAWRALLKEGRKIDAIKLLRSMYETSAGKPLGLKEAKDIVEHPRALEWDDSELLVLVTQRPLNVDKTPTNDNRT